MDVIDLKQSNSKLPVPKLPNMLVEMLLPLMTSKVQTILFAVPCGLWDYGLLFTVSLSFELTFVNKLVRTIGFAIRTYNVVLWRIQEILTTNFVGFKTQQMLIPIYHLKV